MILEEGLPHVLNPKSGIVVSANNRVSTDEVLHGIATAFSMNHRKIRIEELLLEGIKQGKKFTFDDMKRIQSDLLDI